MGRVVHFEITADEPERAQKFYEAAFGWKFQDSGIPDLDYRLAETGPLSDDGINGAIMPKKYHDQPVINTIAVDDLDASMEKVKSLGGKLEGEKNTIPGIGDFCYARDTEGNLLGLLQALPRQGM